MARMTDDGSRLQSIPISTGTLATCCLVLDRSCRGYARWSKTGTPGVCCGAGQAFQQWPALWDNDLSFLLIKMAVSSWIEQAVIDRVGAGVGRWCGRAIVEACPCSSMTWPQACDKT